MAISALPSAPNKAIDTLQEFADKGDAFVAALSTFVTEANDLQTDVNAKQSTATSAASTATTQAGLAAASAASAIASPGTSATSTTSLTTGTGEKTMTVETGKDLVVGMAVMIASTVSPASNWMHGIITSYTAGTGVLIVNVGIVVGSGTIADWVVSLSGPILELGIGNGQSWQDMTASRSLNVVYQNTTSRPISVKVIVTTSTTGSSKTFELFVGPSNPPSPATDIDIFYWLSTWGSSYRTLSVIVPPGHYYQAFADAGITKFGWKELR